MDYQKLLEGILNIGEGLLRNGGETYRIEDSLARMCRSYGFEKINIFVIPSNIQVTATSPDGEIITQIRHIEKSSTDYDNLDLINNLCRSVCANTPGVEDMSKSLEDILNRPRQRRRIKYLAAVLGCAGFSVFFNCSITDALISALIALLITVGGELLSKIESNLLIYNATLSLVAESIILVAANLGLCQHPSSVTLGVVMLLISCLGFINGIREFIERDFLAGAIHVMDSILGASGIALGMLIPMIFFNDVENAGVETCNGYLIPAISMVVACVGFAMLFNIKRWDIAVAGLGSLITWAVYVAVISFKDSNFFATLVAAIASGAFAYFASRWRKAPSTMFLAISVFPVVPGSHMYLMMLNCAIANRTAAINEFAILVIVCLAIAFGFNIENVIERNIVRIRRKTLSSVKK